MSDNNTDKTIGKESSTAFDKALNTLSPDFSPLSITTDDAAELSPEEKAALEADAEAKRIADEEAAKNKPDDTTKKSDEKEIEIEEGQIANEFANLLVDQFELELNDDFKVETLEDVKTLISEIVNMKAQPQFASKEVAELNDIVAKGGDVREYLNNMKEATNWETFKADDQDKQKFVVKEYYKGKGLTDAKIERIINGLILDDELEKEAEEFLPELQSEAKSKNEAIKKSADAKVLQQQEAQKQFFNDTQKFVSELKEFQGAPLSDSDKQRALAYVFAVDKATGKTYEQLDFEQDPIGYRMQLALLRTKKDLQKSLENKATTQSTKKFKTTLRVINAKDVKKQSGTDSGEVSATDLLQKYL